MSLMTSFFSSFIPAKFAGDLSFLLVFVIASLLLAFVLGRTRLVSVVIFSYVALSFVLVIPSSFIGSLPEGRALIFLVLLSMLVIVGDYIVDIHISNPSSTFFSRVLVMGCLGSGLVLSMILSLTSSSFALRFLSPTIYGYFTNPFPRLAWMIVPLVFLLFINKRKR